jgi:hypothetical protein
MVAERPCRDLGKMRDPVVRVLFGFRPERVAARPGGRVREHKDLEREGRVASSADTSPGICQRDGWGGTMWRPFEV